MQRTDSGVLTGHVILFLVSLTVAVHCPGAAEAAGSISTRFNALNRPLQQLRHKRMMIQTEQQLRTLKTRREMQAIDPKIDELRQIQQQKRVPQARKKGSDSVKSATPSGKVTKDQKVTDKQGDKTQELPSKSSKSEKD